MQPTSYGSLTLMCKTILSFRPDQCPAVQNFVLCWMNECMHINIWCNARKPVFGVSNQVIISLSAFRYYLLFQNCARNRCLWCYQITHFEKITAQLTSKIKVKCNKIKYTRGVLCLFEQIWKCRYSFFSHYIG